MKTVISSIDEITVITVSGSSTQLISTDEITIVTVSGSSTQLINNEGVVTVVTNGIQGPPGVGVPMGGTTGQALVKKSNLNFDTEWEDVGLTPGNLASTVIAGENITALRAVYDDPLTDTVLYADKDDLATIKSILGVSSQTVLAGALVTVITSGEVVNPGWSWDMSQDVSLFISNNGIIVQGAPAGLATVRIGYAINPTTAYIRVAESVVNA